MEGGKAGATRAFPPRLASKKFRLRFQPAPGFDLDEERRRISRELHDEVGQFSGDDEVCEKRPTVNYGFARITLGELCYL